MATTFTSFPILSSASSDHRKPDSTRRKPPSSSSSNWWAPLFGWPSDPDYISNSSTTTTNNNESVDRGYISCAAGPSETGRSRSRFAPGCFTEEKAKQLRRKTAESSMFHDIMYHSAIASRLASDVSET